MTEPLFHARGDGVFEPTELAVGPWDRSALHGGAPAALIARAFEALEDVRHLQIGRLDYEFPRPVPLAPLRLRASVEQAGRRVARLTAELHEADGQQRVVCGARALCLAPVPAGLPARAADQPLTPPGQSQPAVFTLNESDEASFAGTAMEMRWAHGEVHAPGPAAVWFRLQVPLVDDEPASPLARLCAAADFGNGISAEVSFHQWVFINADLGVRLHRPPQSEWTALDARTLLDEHGSGLSTSTLHDERGPLGFAQQSLVVARR